jgi:hypothetical protein
MEAMNKRGQIYFLPIWLARLGGMLLVEAQQPM